MVRTIGGGLLTIVCSTEQSVGKLGVEQAGGQVLLFWKVNWKVNCLQYIYFLKLQNGTTSLFEQRGT